MGRFHGGPLTAGAHQYPPLPLSCPSTQPVSGKCCCLSCAGSGAQGLSGYVLIMLTACLQDPKPTLSNLHQECIQAEARFRLWHP